MYIKIQNFIFIDWYCRVASVLASWMCGTSLPMLSTFD
jgi:hypothetical protein